MQGKGYPGQHSAPQRAHQKLGVLTSTPGLGHSCYCPGAEVGGGGSWCKYPTSLGIWGTYACSVCGQDGGGHSQLEWNKDPGNHGVRPLPWERRSCSGRRGGCGMRAGPENEPQCIQLRAQDPWMTPRGVVKRGPWGQHLWAWLRD